MVKKQDSVDGPGADAPSSRCDSRNNDIPVGDSPPRPRWPLVAVAAVWLAWIGFLVVMMVVRIRTIPV